MVGIPVVILWRQCTPERISASTLSHLVEQLLHIHIRRSLATGQICSQQWVGKIKNAFE
jgi:hypothetical protein